MADRYPCVTCRKDVAKTKNDHYRSHSGGDGEPCPSAATPIPEHVLANGPVNGKQPADVPVEGVDYAQCPQCTRKVKLTQLGYFEPHDQTLRGGDRCPVSGVRAKHARSIDDRLLPGDQPAGVEPKVKDSSTPAANRGISAPPTTATPIGADSTPGAAPGQIDWSKVGDLKHLPDGSLKIDGVIDDQKMEIVQSAPSAASSASTATSSPESSTTSTPSQPSTSGPSTSSDAAEVTVVVGPFHLAPLLDERILQPFSHISQPFPVPVKMKLAEVMNEDSRQAAVRFKEVFFSYNNRRSSDNRGAQKTLGPSEIGHECDRRLALSLMGVEPVNPGGDGWAAWLGTQGHRGLDEVFTWASANSGRFVTETRVAFDSQYVPYGTADLFDRVQAEVGDFKFMGEYSLKRLIQQGPPEHYRVQLQVYGLGMELLGEKVRKVSLYGLPRAGSSLDGMYVWTVPYDRKAAQDALKRVDRIAEEAFGQGVGPSSKMEVAQDFATADECRWCPHFLKGDKDMQRGCPGAKG